MAFTISERIIEDILAADKAILAEILAINPSGLSLIARQKILPSGRLDLLWLYEDVLLLVEVKVVPFNAQITDQIDSYHSDLRTLQQQKKLIDAPIHKVVLVTSSSAANNEQCRRLGIRVCVYRPDVVLAKYFEHFKELSYYLTLRSADYGVVRLGLLSSTLALVGMRCAVDDISHTERKSIKTINNRLSVAAQLGLVSKFQGDFVLTDLGEAFIAARDTADGNRLTDEQADILARFVKELPFFSPFTYTILSFVEAIFMLAKSEYPVHRGEAQELFVKSVGKEQTWRAAKARRTATYIFANYACELQFVAAIGDHFFITPKGVQAILLLQLNRSIKLIEALKS